MLRGWQKTDSVLGDRKNMAFMGTMATYGRGKAVVVSTGMQTEIGKIAEMIQSYEEAPTPLQTRLDQLGKWLGWGSLIICGLVFVVALGRDANWAAMSEMGLGAYFQAERETIVELFLVAVSLAIAAVPEGLPAIVTVNLALGMREMIKRNALIRRLQAVETLGSASVICSDKTGTLTQNEMTAVQLSVWGVQMSVTGEGYQPTGRFIDEDDGSELDEIQPSDYPDVALLLRGALLASDAALEPHEESGGVRMVGDPTEGALVVAAAKANMWRDKSEMQYPRVAEVPFDSTRKRMSTIHQDTDGRGYITFVKGAPDFVLDLCSHALRQGEPVPLDEPIRERIIHRQSRNGPVGTARAGGGLSRTGRVAGRDQPRDGGNRTGLCGPGGHDRPGPAGSAPRHGNGPPGRHPHGDGHRRLSRYSPGNRQPDRLAAAGRPGDHRRRPEPDERRATGGSGRPLLTSLPG